MKKGSLIAVLLCFFVFVQAQNLRKCSTMEGLEAEKILNPERAADLTRIETFTQKWIQENGPAKEQMTVITIPVVVHVLYLPGVPQSNISEAQIFSQIDVLNEDYRRLNADTTLTPDVFEPFAADAEFEFCMAQQDPNGLPTTGITRTPTTVTSFNTLTNDAKFDATGGYNAWPADDYLNIWVVPGLDDGLTLGYAQFPGGADATDGVVIGYRYFGRVGNLEVPYDEGRTTTHEVGHWLNLRHIWGDDGGSCSQDDLVNDTPRSGDAYYGCPTGSPNTCTDSPTDYPDMFMNYMDYCNDNCLNIFTNGQKQRMRALFSPGGARYSITQSVGCVPVEQGANDAVLVELLEPVGTGNCTTVEPVITVQNLGTEGLFYFIVEYNFTGGPVQTYEWTGSINSLGSAQITLPPINTVATGIIHNLHINIISPNGLPDFNPDDNEDTYTFATISGGSALPFFEGFEPGTNFNSWFDSNPDGLITFELTNTAAATGTSSVFMNNFIYNASGATDEFVLPHVNLSASNPYLHFDMAYALIQAAGTSDVLQVLISTDCGATYTNIYTKAGEPLSTASPTGASFVPTSGQWRTESISLAAYQGVRNAVLKFKQIRGTGNNLYIDNLNITDGAVGIAQPDAQQPAALRLYPNPAKEQAILQYYAAQPGNALIVVTDLSGRTLQTFDLSLQAGSNNTVLPLQNLANGMYLVTLTNQNGVVATQKITVLR